MAYRLLRAVRTKGKIARPRWASWTSVETARRGTSLARNLLSSGSSYTELRRPNPAARAVRCEREYQSDQPRPQATRGEQPFQKPGAGKKRQHRQGLPLKENGGKGQEAFCCWLLRNKQRPSRCWRPLSPQRFSSLLPHCVLRAFRRRPCAASCSPCSCLQAVGLRRTWDLRGYSGQALALLTNRYLAYSYRHIERFLAELARVGADEVLTHALAGWTASLWKRQPALEDGPVPVYYIDGQTPRRVLRCPDSPWAGRAPEKGAGMPRARRHARSGRPSEPFDHPSRGSAFDDGTESSPYLLRASCGPKSSRASHRGSRGHGSRVSRQHSQTTDAPW